MILAVIGNIGGNLPAFRAVLDAVDGEGIQTLVNTGGSVVGAAWPGQVVELLRERQILSLQDDSDRRAARAVRKKAGDSDSEGYLATHEAMYSGHIEYLLGLPRRKTLSVDGIDLFCSAEGPGATDDEHHFRRLREQANTGIIVFGHSEEGFVRTVDGTLFVNPGSVNLAPGIARYAIVEAEDPPWSAKLCEVRYEQLV